MKLGLEMYQLIQTLYPIPRSLTGWGVRKTLEILGREIPLTFQEVKSGTPVFDWTVPTEWNIRDAYILSPGKEKIVDFKKSNLHVMGYATPIDQTMDLDALMPHLYTLPHMPEAIPYITSYYKENWGFCLSENQRKTLKKGVYRAHIDATLAPGVLNYAEMLIPGKSKKEVLLSSYICHPQMVNNELTGPVLLTFLTKWLRHRNNQYTYRILLAPETIGAIVYLSKHLAHLQEHLLGGIIFTCLGTEAPFSFVESKYGTSLMDGILAKAFEKENMPYRKYSFLDRGSDERQYNSANVDLPVVALSRAKFGDFKEYHTSQDDLSMVSPESLESTLEMLKKIILTMETAPHEMVAKREKRAGYLSMKTFCEPQLGRRGLYPNVSTLKTKALVADMMNVIAYADGTNSDAEICQRAHVEEEVFRQILEKLQQADIIERR